MYKKYQQKNTHGTQTPQNKTNNSNRWIYVAFLNTAHGIPVNKRETLWNTVDNHCEL